MPSPKLAAPAEEPRLQPRIRHACRARVGFPRAPVTDARIRGARDGRAAPAHQSSRPNSGGFVALGRSAFALAAFRRWLATAVVEGLDTDRQCAAKSDGVA